MRAACLTDEEVNENEWECGRFIGRYLDGWVRRERSKETRSNGLGMMVG